MTTLTQSPAAEIAPRSPVELRSSNLAGVNFAQRTIEVIAVPYDELAPVEYRGELWNESFARGAFDGLSGGRTRSGRTAIMISGALSGRLWTFGRPVRRVWWRRFGSLGLSLVMRRWCWPTKTAWARRLVRGRRQGSGVEPGEPVAPHQNGAPRPFGVRPRSRLCGRWRVECPGCWRPDRNPGSR
jgi:hypothetical protein